MTSYSGLAALGAMIGMAGGPSVMLG
jgi:hypothetical protein